MIEFRNVTKSFSEKFLMKDFSFVIQENEKVRISGKSGIGKTTLFKMILGLDFPERGEIWLDGVKLDDVNCWKFRKQMAYLSQDLQLGQGTVMNLFQDTWQLKCNGHLQNSAKGKMYELLDYFDLSKDIVNQQIDKISGGEKQRIAIINAILLNRKWMLLDEFSSALDAKMKVRVFEYLMQLEDKTILFISHDHLEYEDKKINTISL